LRRLKSSFVVRREDGLGGKVKKNTGSKGKPGPTDKDAAGFDEGRGIGRKRGGNEKLSADRGCKKSEKEISRSKELAPHQGAIDIKD